MSDHNTSEDKVDFVNWASHIDIDSGEPEKSIDYRHTWSDPEFDKFLRDAAENFKNRKFP